MGLLRINVSLPVGDGLEEAPEERLRERSSVPLPTPAASLRADVLALDPVDEDGLQGAAEEVSISIFTGDDCVWRHISLLQGLEGLCQLLFDLHVTERGRGEFYFIFLNFLSLFFLVRSAKVVLKRSRLESLFTNMHIRATFSCAVNKKQPVHFLHSSLQCDEVSGHVVIKPLPVDYLQSHDTYGQLTWRDREHEHIKKWVYYATVCRRKSDSSAALWEVMSGWSWVLKPSSFTALDLAGLERHDKINIQGVQFLASFSSFLTHVH